MKKSLLALAVLGAFATGASAQSSVTLSGIVKTGLASTKYSDGRTGNGSGLALNDGSSRFIMSGREDLGGGLFAIFQYDQRFRVDDRGGAPATSPLADGNTFVGLTGGFGTLTMGKMDVHYGVGTDSHGNRATALTASNVTILDYVQGVFPSANAADPGANPGPNVAVANTSRASNMVQYLTPVMGGLQFRVNYSTSFAAAGSEGAVGPTGDGRAYSLGASYAAGPLSLGASIWNARNENRSTGAERGGNDQSSTRLTVNYNFGVATVGYTWDSSAVKTGLIPASNEHKRTAFSIPVTVPMGAGTFLYTFSKAGNTKLNGVEQQSTGAKMSVIGYDYALSKRTSIGVNWTSLMNDSRAKFVPFTQVALSAHAAPANDQDVRQFYMGVRHAF